MLWNVMYFQTLCKPERLFWLNGLIKRRYIVRVQVVTYKNDLNGAWIHVVKKPFDSFAKSILVLCFFISACRQLASGFVNRKILHVPFLTYSLSS